MNKEQHEKTIAKVIKAVFPRGTKIELTNPAAAPENRYIVIYGSKGPRWIVPEKGAGGYPFLAQWRPYKPISNLLWKGLLIAYKIGGLKFLPQTKVIGITPPEALVWDLGAWKPGSVLLPAIYITGKKLLPKVTVGLINRKTKKTDFVLKVALTKHGRSRIRHETKSLLDLKKEIPGISPQVVSSNRQGKFVVLQAIQGPLTGTKLTSRHIEFFKKLRRKKKTTTLEKVSKILAKQISDAGGKTHALMREATEFIADPAEIPLAWVHGDLLPWNLKSTPGGNLVAVDWETARSNGLPLYDIVNFFFMREFLLGRKFPGREKFREIVQPYLASLGIQPDILDKLILACFLDNYLFPREPGLTDWAGNLEQKIETYLKYVKKSYPNFFLVGAMKAGTSTLYHYLSQHPQIFSPTIKEPHYFLWASFPEDFHFAAPVNEKKMATTKSWHRLKTQELYEDIYAPGSNYKFALDASPGYLPHQECAKKIHSLCPNAKIIVVARNPVERAYSGYTYLCSHGREPAGTFRNALKQEMSGKRKNWFYPWRYIYCGMYTKQIETYFKVFGRKNVKIVFFEDLKNNEIEVCKEIFEFIGADPNFRPHPLKNINKTVFHNNLVLAHLKFFVNQPGLIKNFFKVFVPKKFWFTLKGKLSDSIDRFGTAPKNLTKEDEDFLYPVFRDDITSLEKLLNKDLSNWKR